MKNLMLRLRCPMCSNKVLHPTESINIAEEATCDKCKHTFNALENEPRINELRELLED